MQQVPSAYPLDLESGQSIPAITAVEQTPLWRNAETASPLQRTLVFVYGIACYLVFLVTLIYSIGFIGNFLVPTTLDASVNPTADRGWVVRLAINIALLLVFALQHSVMARPWFKSRWTRLVPEPAERSTYVLFSSVAMIAMFVLWQPLGGTIWDVRNPIGVAALYSLFAAGWLLVLTATFLINHFDLFGLRHVWLYFRRQPYTHLPFKIPSLYRVVRHPLYVGWITVFWATPTMTISHLFFAVITTGYILLAIGWEERDLVDVFGQKYLDYRKSVPKLIPALRTASNTTR